MLHSTSCAFGVAVTLLWVLHATGATTPTPLTTSSGSSSGWDWSPSLFGSWFASEFSSGSGTTAPTSPPPKPTQPPTVVPTRAPLPFVHASPSRAPTTPSPTPQSPVVSSKNIVISYINIPTCFRSASNCYVEFTGKNLPITGWNVAVGNTPAVCTLTSSTQATCYFPYNANNLEMLSCQVPGLSGNPCSGYFVSMSGT